VAGVPTRHDHPLCDVDLYVCQRCM